MPSPCSTSLNSDPASLASLISPGSLGSAASDSSGASASSADSFDNVLSQVDASGVVASSAAEATEEPETDDASDTPQVCAPLNADQLAWLGAMMVPPPAPAPLPPPVSTDATCDLPGVELTLEGANGRTKAEILATGVDVLEYSVASATAEGGDKATFAGANLGADAASADSDAKTAGETPLSAATGEAADSSTASGTDKSGKSNSQQSGQQDAQASAGNPAHPSLLPHASQRGLLRGVLAHAAKFASNQPASPVDAETTNATAAPVAANADGSELPQTTATAVTPGTTPPANELAAKVSGLLSGGRQASRVNFAGDAANQAAAGGMSPASEGKKINLNVGQEEVTSDVKAVGTAVAKWGKTMLHDARKSALAALQTEIPVLAGSAGIGSGTTTMNPSSPTSAVEPTSHAAELVHEIRDIADGLWAVDRNSVEVKFNFGANDRLAVRVEYRAGTVHATFRTDSPELRDAIAREWQAQTASSDYRPYRVADPVFTGSGFSFAGGDASRQQQQQRSAEEARSFERAASLGATRSAPATTSTSAASPATRPESTGYLHAIV